jgi:capsular polysaccharide transport system ATP-binding protein
MIELVSVTKMVGRDRQPILSDLSCVFETKGNYVIFGLRYSGKSTLLYLLSGLENPTRGRITRYGSVGIPAGYGTVRGGWDSAYTYVTFLSQLYHVDPKEVADFVADFADLGEEMSMPLSALDADARRRFYFALSYAIPVDFYLFDNAIAWRGDKEFQRKCVGAFDARRRNAGTIVTTRSVHRVREFGDRGGVLHDGQLHLFNTVEEAVEAFERYELSSQLGSLSFARTLLGKGDLGNARKYVAEYQTAHPDDVGGYELQAELAYKASDFREAAAAAAAVLARSPKAADAHLMLGKVAMREMRFKDAIAHTQDALHLAPGHGAATALMAKMRKAVGADTQKRRPSPSDPGPSGTDHLSESSKQWGQTIRAEAKSGKWSQVLETIKQTSAETGDPDAWLALRLRALVEVGRFAEAEEPLLKLAEQDLDKALAFVLRAAKKHGAPHAVAFLNLLRERTLLNGPTSLALPALTKLIEREAPRMRQDCDIQQALALDKLLVFLNHKNAAPAGEQ